MSNYRDEYREFRAYCRTLTDAQVRAVFAKERSGKQRDPDREAHYDAICDEADRRDMLAELLSS